MTNKFVYHHKFYIYHLAPAISLLIAENSEVQKWTDNAMKNIKLLQKDISKKLG